MSSPVLPTTVSSAGSTRAFAPASSFGVPVPPASSVSIPSVRAGPACIRRLFAAGVEAGCMNETRRELLAAFAEGPATGPALAERLGVSRAAVWKQVEALRGAGFDIESGDDGYRVTDVPAYGAAAVEFGLDAPYEVEFHEA